MSRKAIISGTVVLITLLFIGWWFWSINSKQRGISVEDNLSKGEDLEQDQVWYPIPELGIKIELNKEFAADLVYEYKETPVTVGKDSSYQDPSYKVAQFSSRFLEKIDPEYCSPKDDPLGYLSRISRKEGERILRNDKGNFLYSRIDPNYQYSSKKWFSSFIVLWEGPQSVCWLPERDDEVAEYFQKFQSLPGNTNLSDALKSAQPL